MESAVSQALEHPVTGEQLHMRLGDHPIKLPLPVEYYDMIELVEPDEGDLEIEPGVPLPQPEGPPVNEEGIHALPQQTYETRILLPGKRLQFRFPCLYP